MKATRVKPITKDTRDVAEKIVDLIQESEGTDKIVTLKESDLKRLIVKIIVELDANYVRKSDLKREMQLVFQEMVKKGIRPEGKQ